MNSREQMETLKKAVFLDRDGTIIQDLVYLNDPEKIYVLDGAVEAIRKLNEAGFEVFMATNQSGIARGLVQMENLLKINQRIIDNFLKDGARITHAYFCPHPVDGGCACRKPNAGMLTTGAKEFGIDLKRSWMVGDRMTDVLAGTRAGCRSVLLQNEHTPPIEYQYGSPEFISASLLAASQLIIERD